MDRAVAEPSELNTSKVTANAELNASEAYDSSSDKCHRGSPDQPGNMITRSDSRDSFPAPQSPVDGEGLAAPRNKDDEFRFIGEHVDPRPAAEPAAIPAVEHDCVQLLAEDDLNIEDEASRPILSRRRHTLPGSRPEKARERTNCPSCTNPDIGCAVHESGLRATSRPTQRPRISTRTAIGPLNTERRSRPSVSYSTSYDTHNDPLSGSSAYTPYTLSTQPSSVHEDPECIPRYVPWPIQPEDEP